MDFRAAPQPSELTWLAPRGGPTARSKTAAATYNGKKILVQTPECATRMFVDMSSRTLYLQLPGDSDIHADFAQWIQSYEDFAASKFEGVEVSPSVRNGSLRLMVWDDTQWFDDSGTFLKDPPKALDKCTCILEFGGAWVSPGKWGLKFRATQIRAASGGGGGGSGSGSGSGNGGGPKKEYAFLDD
jgi:hypothetical protein